MGLFLAEVLQDKNQTDVYSFADLLGQVHYLSEVVFDYDLFEAVCLPVVEWSASLQELLL